MSHSPCYSVRMKIKIEEIKPLASQRTKNRIRENGPWFTVERQGGQAFGIGHAHGEASWLLRGDNWLGWLPINEFRITEKSAWHLLK